MRSIGFYWGYKTGPQYLNSIQFGKYTDVIYAHVIPTSQSNMTLVDYTGGSLSKITDLRTRAKTVNPSCNVLLGLYLPDASFMSNATSRSALVAEVLAKINAYSLVGVAIDWEANVNSTYYGLFLSALRVALGSKLILPVGDQWAFFVNFSDVQYVDFIWLMEYDFARYPHRSTYGDVTKDLQRWLSAGYPANKLCMGIPFYGSDAYVAGHSPNVEAATWRQIVATINPEDDVSEWPISSIGGETVDGGILAWSSPAENIAKIKWCKDHGIDAIGVFCIDEDDFGTNPMIDHIYGGSMVTITAGNTTTLDTTMTPNPTTGALSGKVTDSVTGLPLAGVSVSIGSWSGITNSSGDYAVVGITPGTYEVTFTKSGYQTVTV